MRLASAIYRVANLVIIYVVATRSQRPRAFTDLSAARVWGQSYMHSLQPCQLGNDSLLNMFPIPPLGRCDVE